MAIVALDLLAVAAPARSSETPRETAAHAEEPIADALERWWTALARHPLSGPDADSAASRRQAILRFDLAPESAISSAEQPRWLARHRPDHTGVEYRLAALEISATTESEVEARFVVERRSLDASGQSHIARWQQRWRLSVGGEGAPTVVSIQEEPRLAFPGTGPQIVCF